jgi:hypothetical protein
VRPSRRWPEAARWVVARMAGKARPNAASQNPLCPPIARSGKRSQLQRHSPLSPLTKQPRPIRPRRQRSCNDLPRCPHLRRGGIQRGFPFGVAQLENFPRPTRLRGLVVHRPQATGGLPGRSSVVRVSRSGDRATTPDQVVLQTSIDGWFGWLAAQWSDAPAPPPSRRPGHSAPATRRATTSGRGGLPGRPSVVPVARS